MEDQWWPDVDDPPIDPQEQHWPDVDELSDWVAAIQKAFEKAMESVANFGGRYVIVSAKLAEQLKELGYHSPLFVHGGSALYNRTQPIEDAAEGYKRLKSGRQMPIVVKGSGPKKDPHRRRGKG